MAKQANQSKLSQKQDHIVLEQNMVVDDSLLPSAEELSKLNDIDPSILPWLMERTALEQNARIKFNEDRIKIANKDLKSTNVYNMTSLIFAFVILLVGIGFSGLLVHSGLSTEGTIFGGGTLALAAYYFIDAPRKRNSNNNKQK